jgi:LCP family protein required for cell wall assembly
LALSDLVDGGTNKTSSTNSSGAPNSGASSFVASSLAQSLNIDSGNAVGSNSADIASIAIDKQIPDTELSYAMPSKPDDERKHIVRIPKTNRQGDVKVNRKGVAKCKIRIQQFLKDGTPRIRHDGYFKLRFTNAKRTAVAFLVLVLAVIGTSGTYAAYFLNQVSQALVDRGAVIGSLSEVAFKDDPLEVDKYGRTNFMILGTSEDDEGHGGASLTDSILILSINPSTGDAKTVSIPRDLTYKDKSLSKNGRVLCSAGTTWKINVGYMCGVELSDSDDEIQQQRDGLEHDKKIIEDVTGLDIQYYAKVDYSVVVDVVDALGGITVTPYSDDPRGIWDINTKLRLPATINNLDGGMALLLCRARGDWGGYGLSRSNFDREINQQLVLNAIRIKASSEGIMSNPQQMLKLIEALGEHVVTNLPTSQFRALGKVANSMGDMKSVPLQAPADYEVDPPLPPVMLVTAGGSAFSGLGSVVVPTEGEFEWSAIRAYIRAMFDGQTLDQALELAEKTAKSATSTNPDKTSKTPNSKSTSEDDETPTQKAPAGRTATSE